MAGHILDHLEFHDFGRRGDVSNHVPAGEEALLLFVLVHEDGGQIRSGKRDWIWCRASRTRWAEVALGCLSEGLYWIQVSRSLSRRQATTLRYAPFAQLPAALGKRCAGGSISGRRRDCPDADRRRRLRAGPCDSNEQDLVAAPLPPGCFSGKFFSAPTMLAGNSERHRLQRADLAGCRGNGCSDLGGD